MHRKNINSHIANGWVTRHLELVITEAHIDCRKRCNGINGVERQVTDDMNYEG
jgi:hypothetical protein